MLLSRKEKEKLVIKLAQEGKTTREIAKIAHMSLKDIGEIIKKATGDDDDKDSKNNKIAEKEKERLSQLSPCTQAFQIFREKKSLIDVVITLDLDPETVLDYHRDYLRLSGMSELIIIYDNFGKDLPLFLHLFNRIKEQGLSRDEIAYMIEMQSDIAEMQETVGWLNKHISELEKDKEEFEQEIFRLERIKDSGR